MAVPPALRPFVDAARRVPRCSSTSTARSSPIVPDPAAARPLPAARAALARLVPLLGTVAVVSGRPAAFLREHARDRRPRVRRRLRARTVRRRRGRGRRAGAAVRRRGRPGCRRRRRRAARAAGGAQGRGGGHRALARTSPIGVPRRRRGRRRRRRASGSRRRSAGGWPWSCGRRCRSTRARRSPSCARGMRSRRVRRRRRRRPPRVRARCATLARTRRRSSTR